MALVSQLAVHFISCSRNMLCLIWCIARITVAMTLAAGNRSWRNKTYKMVQACRGLQHGDIKRVWRHLAAFVKKENNQTSGGWTISVTSKRTLVSWRDEGREESGWREGVAAYLYGLLTLAGSERLVARHRREKYLFSRI